MIGAILFGILSYFVSIGVIYITNQRVIHFITKMGYTIKNGDKSSLYNEIDAPSTYITKFMLFCPYLNVIGSLLEGILTVTVIDDIISDLLEEDIIAPLSKQEKIDFEKQNQSLKAAFSIVDNRERDYEYLNTFKLEKRNVMRINEDCQNQFQEPLDKILSSDISVSYKIELLRILKYCIIHKISNLNIDCLLESISLDNKLVDPYYIQLFYFEENFEQESMILLITVVNEIICHNDLDDVQKKYFLSAISKVIGAKIKKKNVKLLFDFRFDPNDIYAIDISVKEIEDSKTRKLKQKKRNT